MSKLLKGKIIQLKRIIENCEALIKEIEDTSKWKHILFSLVGRINIVTFHTTPNGYIMHLKHCGIFTTTIKMSLE